MDLPPRGPAVPTKLMLLSFDIDCGELIAGHRVIARGLKDQGTMTVDGQSAPGFSLEYELVPGVESQYDRNIFHYLVGIDYQADTPLPWPANESGAIATFNGGPSTHGSGGDWPLPEGTRHLTFRLTGIDETTGGPRQEEDGVLEIDLQEGSAHWYTRRPR